MSLLTYLLTSVWLCELCRLGQGGDVWEHVGSATDRRTVIRLFGHSDNSPGERAVAVNARRSLRNHRKHPVDCGTRTQAETPQADSAVLGNARYVHCIEEAD